MPAQDFAFHPIDLTDDASLIDAARTFHVAGAAWIRPACPRAIIEACADHLSGLFADESACQRSRQAVRVGNRRYMIPAVVDGPLADPELLTHPSLLAFMRRVLGADAIVNSVGIVCAFPGAEPQDMHRDHPLLFDDGADLPAYAVTVMMPLVNLDAEIGTTAIWEGSHRWPDQNAHGRWPTLPYAGVGDAYLMDYRIVHAGAPNHGTRARPILYAVFSKCWFRDAANYATIPPLCLGRAGIALARNHPSLFRWFDTSES